MMNVRDQHHRYLREEESFRCRSDTDRTQNDNCGGLRELHVYSAVLLRFRMETEAASQLLGRIKNSMENVWDQHHRLLLA